MQQHRFVCDVTRNGRRLDVWLTEQMDGITRSAIQRLIEAGRCLVDGKPARPSHKMKPEQVVILTVPEPQTWAIEAEDLPLRILFQDSDIAIIDKPTGMVVHPGAGHRSGTLVSALLHHIPGLTGVGGVERPGIVHRLDKGTSGVMIIAKNDPALAALQQQFSRRQIKKTYVALIWGQIKEPTGQISLAIGRSRTHAKMTTRAHTSKTALTRYEVSERFSPWCDLVYVYPATGRTHQIRVHFAAIGHPLIGDPSYGRQKKLQTGAPVLIQQLNRPALHAWKIGFAHPRTGMPLEFEAPMPQDFLQLLDELRRQRANRTLTTAGELSGRG